MVKAQLITIADTLAREFSCPISKESAMETNVFFIRVTPDIHFVLYAARRNTRKVQIKQILRNIKNCRPSKEEIPANIPQPPHTQLIAVAQNSLFSSKISLPFISLLLE